MEKPTAQELRVILKACKENGVSSFVFGNLRVEFRPESNIIESVATELPHNLNEEPQPIEKRIQKQREDYENLLSEARLLDPSLYESLVENELIDGGDKTENI